MMPAEMGQESPQPVEEEVRAASDDDLEPDMVLNPYPGLEALRDNPDYSDSLYVKGVVYGFVRLRLDSTKADSDWHCWTLFLQSSHGLDLSPIISKVSFIIHEDFIHPTRSVTEPPYEITVLGKKAFTAIIEVFYRDPTVSPSFFSVTISFQDSERYKRVVRSDVLVFIRPPIEFARLLDIVRPSPVLSGISHHLDSMGFVRRQNILGVIPDLIDEGDVWRRQDTQGKHAQANRAAALAGPSAPVLRNHTTNYSAYFLHNRLDSVYQYDCDELGGSVGVFEVQADGPGKGERRTDSELEFRRMLQSIE